MPELNGRLNITVVGAKNLPDNDTWSGVSDPYCIVKLDDYEIGRTVICENNGSPTWNENFFINLQGDGDNIIFEIWDEDTGRCDDLLSSISVPVSSISEAGEAEEKTAELQTPDGNPAGEFTYSLR